MQKPLDLPQFILLIGGTDTEQRLISTQVCAETLSTLPESLRAPLIDATIALFMSGNYNLLMQSDLDINNIKLKTGLTVAETTDLLRRWMQENFGTRILADLCINGLDTDIASGFVITDVTNTAEVNAFTTTFGVENCIVLCHVDSPYSSVGTTLEVCEWETIEEAMDILHGVSAFRRPVAHTEGSAA